LAAAGRSRSGDRSEAETILAEAREIFERLAAAPWLERLALVQAEAAPLAG
jgi:hypothetical protein